MNCKEVQRHLTENPNAGASEEVRAHLAGCEGCRELSRDLQELVALSEQLKQSETEVPPFFAARVCSRIEPGRPRLLYFRLAALMGALAVVSIGIAALPALFESAVGPGSINRPGAVLRPELATQVLPNQRGLNQREDSDPLEPEPISSPVVIRENPSSGYQLEMPATIEVRQTQAENEFYLRNVSH